MQVYSAVVWFQVVDEAGEVLPRGEEGNLGIRVKPHKPFSLFTEYTVLFSPHCTSHFVQNLIKRRFGDMVISSKCMHLSLYKVSLQLSLSLYRTHTKTHIHTYTCKLTHIHTYTHTLSLWQGDPERTAECYRGDFYLTGDRGFMDEDGYLWFVGRADDVILSAG